MTNRLMTTIEAADYLTLGKTTLERWRLTGQGPRFAKMGAAVRYRQEDLDAFVFENLVKTTEEGMKK